MGKGGWGWGSYGDGDGRKNKAHKAGQEAGHQAESVESDKACFFH